MSRRRKILAGLAALFTIAAVVVGIQWLLAPKHRINKESLELIKEGMTQKEVEDILGVPPGDYSYGGFRDLYFDTWSAEPVSEEWVGEETGIYVTFDPHGGRVAFVRSFNVHPSVETILTKIKRWLGISSPEPNPYIYY